MIDKNVIEERLRMIKPVLKDKFHVKKIGLFGSYARGEQTDESDIDILVEFSKPVGFEFIELKFFLEDLLDKKVDLVTPNALKLQIKERIMKEVIYQ